MRVLRKTAFCAALLISISANAQRLMENLDRGVAPPEPLMEKFL